MLTETRHLAALAIMSVAIASPALSLAQDSDPQTRGTEPAVGPRAYEPPRVIERDREGEVYIAGFGGFTWGHQLGDTEGLGALEGQSFGDRDLKDSVVYGAKIGYFHPGRLSWLGLEVEGFNTTPHIEQSANLPGSHLRVTTLAFNVIARTRLACRTRDRDDLRGVDERRLERSVLSDNERCPLQLYAGAGPGIFFAEASNQFGSSSEHARVGLNALAGARYYFHRNLAFFTEYKFNYANLEFTDIQGTGAGFRGDYMASHVVGGLSVHF